MKKIFCYILFINVLFLVYGQKEMKDVYDFPIKSGSVEWKQFESIQKRIDALQIPDVVLVKISTEGLLETCLNFPYLNDIFYFDNYQQGFEALTSEFNGFRELLKRPDLINVLLNKYKSLCSDVKNIRLQEEVEQGIFTFRHFVLEFMLAQDVVLRNLSLEQEKALFLLTFEHKKMKSDYSDIFSNLNIVPTNVLYVKKVMNDPDFKFQSTTQRNIFLDFVQAPILIDQQQMRIIDEFINVKYK
jgi:hypothetical protein